MSGLTITVPREYGYVLAVATASYFTSIWHAARTSPFRRAAGVPYPIPYAIGNLDEKHQHKGEKAKAEYLFNCAQRAHGNFLEHQTSFLGALFVAGLTYPVAAAGLGASWLAARILYARGYTDPNAENGKGRTFGSISAALLSVALYGLSGKTAYDLVMAA